MRVRVDLANGGREMADADIDLVALCGKHLWQNGGSGRGGATEFSVTEMEMKRRQLISLYSTAASAELHLHWVHATFGITW